MYTQITEKQRKTYALLLEYVCVCVHLNLVDSSPDERRFLQLETGIVLMPLHFRAKEGEGLFVFFFYSPDHHDT